MNLECAFVGECELCPSGYMKVLWSPSREAFVEGYPRKMGSEESRLREIKLDSAIW